MRSVRDKSVAVPTHVGVNRKKDEIERQMHRRPHARGGEPTIAPRVNRTHRPSPRTWG